MNLIINGESLPPETIEQEFQRVKAEFEQRLMESCCHRNAEFMGIAKENLISQVLVKQAALKTFDSVDSNSIEKKYQQMHEQAGGEMIFLAQLGATHDDVPKIKQEISTNLKIEQFIEQLSASPKTFTEAEQLSFYHEHAAAYQTPVEVNVVHITKSSHTLNNRIKTELHLSELRKQAQAGADFKALAQQEQENKDQQIDLGWFKRGEFMPEFETIVFSMNAGEISPVFQTQLGLHLCKVLDKKEPTLLPFETVQPDVLMRMQELHKDDLFNQELKKLIATAVIEDDDPDHQQANCC
jgi:parvulin-like peptidyl-prolyl isomerase